MGESENHKYLVKLTSEKVIYAPDKEAAKEKAKYLWKLQLISGQLPDTTLDAQEVNDEQS